MTALGLIANLKSHIKVKSDLDLLRHVEKLEKQIKKENEICGKYCDLISLMADGMDYDEALKEVKL